MKISWFKFHLMKERLFKNWTSFNGISIQSKQKRNGKNLFWIKKFFFMQINTVSVASSNSYCIKCKVKQISSIGRPWLNDRAKSAGPRFYYLSLLFHVHSMFNNLLHSRQPINEYIMLKRNINNFTYFANNSI